MSIKLKAARSAAAAVTAFGVLLAAAQPAQAWNPAPVIQGIASEVIALDAPTALAAARAGLITLTAGEALAAVAIPAATAWCFFNCGSLISTIRAKVKDFTNNPDAIVGADPALPYGTRSATEEGIFGAAGAGGVYFDTVPNQYTVLFPATASSKTVLYNNFRFTTPSISGGDYEMGANCMNVNTGAITYERFSVGWHDATNSTHWGALGAYGIYPCNATGLQLVKLCIWDCGIGTQEWTYQGATYLNQVKPATVKIDITCKTPGGGSSTYSVQGSATDADVNLTIPECPSGTYRKAVDVFRGPQGGTLQQTGHAAVPDSVEASYPNCVIASANPCQVRVTVDGQIITDGSNLADPAIQYALQHSTYGCSFTNGTAAYAVPLASCLPIVNAYLDPTATASPTASPSATPTGIPSNDPTATPSPSPTAPSDCAPSGWGYLNPFTLVGSMGCLLQYLFIPNSAALESSFAGVQAAWDGSSVGQFTTAMVAVPASLAGLGAAGGGSSHCEGPLVELPAPFNVSFHLLGACDPPFSQLAFGARSIQALFIIVNGSALVYRPIQQALNLPGLPWGRKENA